MRLAHEARGDVVEVVLDAPAQVVLVLLRHRRQLEDRARQVDALRRAEHAAVAHAALDRAVRVAALARGARRLDLERDEPVVEQDHRAGADRRRELLVVAVEPRGRAALARGRVVRQLDRGALLERDALRAVGEQARAHLGPLRVEQRGAHVLALAHRRAAPAHRRDVRVHAHRAAQPPEDVARKRVVARRVLRARDARTKTGQSERNVGQSRRAGRFAPGTTLSSSPL